MMRIKIEKKKLDDTKKYLDACKPEYQKLFCEYDALKKRYCELE